VPNGKATLKLFLSHREALIRYAKRIMGETADAEDIVQEAWLRASTGTAKLPAPDAIAYLRMTVRNLALNGTRRKQIEARIFDARDEIEAIGIASDQPDPEVIAISRDEYARIIFALREMPEKMRIAVEMHRIGGKKLTEIAAFLGISKSTAHTLILEGIERCRAIADRMSA